MFSLKQEVDKAIQNKTAIGHFNVSNFEMLKAVFLATQEMSKIKSRPIPVIIGLSESERKFIGSKQAVAFIKSWREENNYPVFINADHCRSPESAREATEAGFDTLVIDNSELPFEANVNVTKETVSLVKNVRPEILTEGELGFVGASSELLNEIPSEAEVADDQLTVPADAAKFVQETGVDFLAPAVGNLHGVLKNNFNPRLNIARIKEIVAETKIPLVLHGGSGVSKEDIKNAVFAGISIVHISTELRMAFSSALKNLNRDFFLNNPDEIAPSKIMISPIAEMRKIVSQKLKLFS